MSQKDVSLAHKWVEDADRILVTASNGFSISEGLNLFANDQKLKEALGDLVDKYNLPNLFTALNYSYSNQLDYWRVVSRVVEYYNYQYHGSQFMNQVRELINDRPYYIWTSNVNHHFNQAGFKNVFELEGNWVEGVCTTHSQEHPTVDLSEKLHQIYQKDKNNILTESDMPKCLECGAELRINVASSIFQINKKQIENFRNFLAKSEDKKLLIIELGIGPNNKMIKEPSMQLVASLPQSHYITINKGEINIAPEIASQSIGFSGTIGDALTEIITNKSIGVETIAPKKIEKPRYTPQQLVEQEKMMQKFYPNYMIDNAFHGSLPMYFTVDKDHPALLHGSEMGQSWMYSLGDSAIFHCFTPDGQYSKVRVGLNKSKNEVHGFYTNPGTLIGIELIENQKAGFSQLSTNLPLRSNDQILLPKIDKLKQLFPEQRDVIERLSGN